MIAKLVLGNASGVGIYGNFTNQTACCCLTSGVCRLPPPSPPLECNSTSGVNCSNTTAPTTAPTSAPTPTIVNETGWPCAGTCNYLTKKCPSIDFNAIPKPVASYTPNASTTNASATTLFANGLMAPYFVLIRTFENSGGAQHVHYCS